MNSSQTPWPDDTVFLFSQRLSGEPIAWVAATIEDDELGFEEKGHEHERVGLKADLYYAQTVCKRENKKDVSYVFVLRL